MLIGNAVVGQSGGPTAAINATLSGVVAGAKSSPAIETIYGMQNGIEGFLQEKFIRLTDILKTDKDHFLLECTPAAALGSCRKKLPQDYTDEIYQQIFSILQKYNIRYFFYIGGNDSMDTVHKLSEYIKTTGYEIRIMGIPKTIDNDLIGTDHTPGFGSAAKFVATSIQEIVRDCAVYTVKAVTIVEIMGRDAGWLTAAAGLPRLTGGGAADLIYLPEVIFDYDDFIESVEKELQKKPNVVIAVSEGIQDKNGKYVGEATQSGSKDVFGHKYLAGTAKRLEHLLKEKLNYSLLLLDNSHYNQYVNEGQKLSCIKAKLYNQAMINVIQRIEHPVSKVTIDAFLSPKKYYRYLKNKIVVVRHIEFKEEMSLAMKCARILSQYAYLQYYQNMCQSLNTTLPRGFNILANDTGTFLVQEYGKDILYKVSKTNFPNYKQILERVK